jgi:subtilisin
VNFQKISKEKYMKNIFLLIIFALIVLTMTACSSGSSIVNSGSRNTSSVTAGSSARYIVVMNLQTSTGYSKGLENALARRPDFSYSNVFTGFAGVMTDAEVRKLKADVNVKYVEPDLTVSIVGKPGGGTPPPEALPWGVNRIDADLNTGTGGAGVAVAVIDTGVDIDHPDLGNAYIGGVNFVKAGTVPEDDNGHGTHVAGIIAARDNSIGYIGVAPNASIVAVKVLNRNGTGTLSAVIAGIDWVKANASMYGIKVANMSLSAKGDSQAMYDAIAGATANGVTFVVAASNETTNANQYVPAKFDNVICVSALTSTNTLASYSNYGDVVDMIAPGSSIPSLWKSGGYNTISGTSMASPHVAGAAALWLDDHSGGFSEVYAALTGAGEASPVGGWPGDPDGIAEPLVDAQNL